MCGRPDIVRCCLLWQDGGNWWTDLLLQHEQLHLLLVENSLQGLMGYLRLASNGTAVVVFERVRPKRVCTCRRIGEALWPDFELLQQPG